MMPGYLWEKVDKIDGWLAKDEAQQLYDLCNGVWCELGSWMGRSTNVLADKGYGYAIDWFKGNEETQGSYTLAIFEANTKGLNIKVIPKRFEDAVNEVKQPIQLLFLDAEHTYEATKQAFELYEPKVIKGGYIILHDANGYMGMFTTFPGVTKFANELMEDDRFEFVTNVNRSRAFKKL